MPAIFGRDTNKTAVFLVVRGEVVLIAGIIDNLCPFVGSGDGMNVLEVLPGDEADGSLDLLFGDSVLAGIGELVVALVGGEVDGVLAKDGLGFILCACDQ